MFKKNNKKLGDTKNTGKKSNTKWPEKKSTIPESEKESWGYDMTGILLGKEEGKIFRKNYLFTREALIKSFKMFIEHIEQNEYPKCSPAAIKNRLKLCNRFLNTLEKCKLPELTQLWNFYEYRFLVSNITLELCDASELEVENDEIKTMSITVEHLLLDIETELLSIEKFAELHQVNVNTVLQWINRGKIRRARRTDQGWLIPDTEDRPGRTFETVEYIVKKDCQIKSNEFPTLALAEAVFIYQDDDEKKKYYAIFKNFTTDYRCKIDLDKDDVERLEYILIESGKTEIEDTIQFVPDIW